MALKTIVNFNDRITTALTLNQGIIRPRELDLLQRERNLEQQQQKTKMVSREPRQVAPMRAATSPNPQLHSSDSSPHWS